MNIPEKQNSRAGPVNGFTLMEMLVVLVLVASLAAFAVPAHQASMRKARLAMVKIDMQMTSVAIEKWRTERGSYSGFSMAEAGLEFLAGSHYEIQVGVLTPFSYRITAVASGGQSGHWCDAGESITADRLTLDESGHRFPEPCWR